MAQAYGATARRWRPRAPPFGEHLFNRAFGFTDATLDAAAEVADWYAEGDVRGAFEIVPGLPTGALMAMLHERGYRHTGFHANFAGHAELPQQPSPGVEVRRLTDETDLEAFSDAYHLGWNTTQFRVPVEPWLAAPGWSLYLGLCDGEPAGAAILSMAGGDAYLADSAVDPSGVAAASTARYWTDAAPTRSKPGRRWCSRARTTSPPAAATCCARASACSTPRRSGPRRPTVSVLLPVREKVAAKRSDEGSMSLSG